MNKFNKIKRNTGSLLLELLIVISILAVILSFSANAIFLSMKSNRVSGERDVSSSLASEEIEAVRAVTEEDWQNIYGLTKSIAHYYPTQSSGKWILSSGDGTVILNGITYTRYITIDNVSRDATTRDIENTYISSDDDPSTQKVTAVVSWSGGNSFTTYEYFFRWKNKICGQNAWTTGGSGNTVKNCTDASYDIKDSNIDVSTGVIKLQ
ncbi:MAG: hypothetical protein NT068_00550 [Candidatus Nomurabacteria bacterium]|nr:hypothetical protein [Candidatus Nomurabacteria bacterium]